MRLVLGIFQRDGKMSLLERELANAFVKAGAHIHTLAPAARKRLWGGDSKLVPVDAFALVGSADSFDRPTPRLEFALRFLSPGGCKEIAFPGGRFDSIEHATSHIVNQVVTAFMSRTKLDEEEEQKGVYLRRQEAEEAVKCEFKKLIVVIRDPHGKKEFEFKANIERAFRQIGVAVLDLDSASARKVWEHRLDAVPADTFVLVGINSDEDEPFNLNLSLVSPYRNVLCEVHAAGYSAVELEEEVVYQVIVALVDLKISSAAN